MVFVVVTTISAPNKVLKLLAKGCNAYGYQFLVIGDKASPDSFQLDACRFISLKAQFATDLKLARLLPIGHYARKNLGYLLAIKSGASRILETDDDNLPYETFWQERPREQCVTHLENAGWVNIYRYFSNQLIWPRGFPLEKIQHPLTEADKVKSAEINCPIHQGLVDNNPDVDAIYRLIFPTGENFLRNKPIALSRGSWCPFNSQNTTWFPEAFPLAYLPSYCSFRLTDIWRSFIAQIIAWINGWGILYHEATMSQERNPHDLMHDFEDEIPGYLKNDKLCEELAKLPLKSGQANINENLLLCYERMISLGIMNIKELDLVEAWIEDLAGMR